MCPPPPHRSQMTLEVTLVPVEHSQSLCPDIPQLRHLRESWESHVIVMWYRLRTTSIVTIRRVDETHPEWIYAVHGWIYLLDYVERFEGSIELCQLLQLQLLQVVVVTRNIYATLNDVIDLCKRKVNNIQITRVSVWREYTLKFQTTTPTRSTPFLTVSGVYPVISAWSGSSSPGWGSRERPTFPSFVAPLPRIIILVSDWEGIEQRISTCTNHLKSHALGLKLTTWWNNAYVIQGGKGGYPN